MKKEKILIIFQIKEISKYKITFFWLIPSLSCWPRPFPKDRTQDSIFWPFMTSDSVGTNLCKMPELHLPRLESGTFVLH
jgi:hypothetical protein